ncbi:hypothetical protein V1477_017128 [Vespula maculifrons]|uniref:Uncharacterized protein n=1 Tax=Vespula maculifrons TaxID=7453 RepID=A0ABD2B544_VESMC
MLFQFPGLDWYQGAKSFFCGPSFYVFRVDGMSSLEHNAEFHIFPKKLIERKIRVYIEGSQ